MHVASSSTSPVTSRVALKVRYPSPADARRDRLRDFPRGILARTQVSVEVGDVLDVFLEVEDVRAAVSATGEVRWATPLASGSIVGLELAGATPRDDVKLDLLLGIRSAGTADADSSGACTEPDAPGLSVALLQPNPVLQQVLAAALDRFARERSMGALRLETAVDAPSFVAAVAARHPDLAIIDCDGLASRGDPVVDAVRSHEPSERVPVILLSEMRSPGLEDRYTVTMRKPVWMKALLHTADLLLRS